MNVVICIIIVHNSLNHGLTLCCIFTIQAQKIHLRVYHLSVLQVMNLPQKSREVFQVKSDVFIFTSNRFCIKQ